MQNKNTARSFLDHLLKGPGSGPMPSAMIVAAHPDDEAIGLGACLPRLRECIVAHLTDGAPKDMVDAGAAGFKTRDDYAGARRRELRKALDIAGIGQSGCLELGAIDQEASFDLPGLTLRLVEIALDFHPGVILTHAYEGGHPDHDAAAFIVHAASHVLRRKGLPTPPGLIEFTSYHLRDGGMAVYEFLPRPGFDAVTLHLSEEDKRLKRRMFDCFVTQQKVLRAFPIALERFRPAPPYDFTSPPHEGPLFYENFPWGITGEQWRSLAAEAQTGFGMDGCP